MIASVLCCSEVQCDGMVTIEHDPLYSAMVSSIVDAIVPYFNPPFLTCPAHSTLALHYLLGRARISVSLMSLPSVSFCNVLINSDSTFSCQEILISSSL